MPIVMSVGKHQFDCRSTFHPSHTCRSYMLNKLYRGMIVGIKYSVIATVLPRLLRQREKLLKVDTEERRRRIWRMLKAFLGPILFIMLATCLPFILQCNVPSTSMPFKSLSFSTRYMLTYCLFPIACLIIDSSTRMPSMVGFFGAKAIN